MQPKLLQTEAALYLIEGWDGKNTSGFRPTNNLILVKADECAPYSAGGVFLDDETKERNSLASETGVIVYAASQAFKITLDGRPWPDDDPDKPKVGDRIRFLRYAGSVYLGYDKRLYRCMKDSEVAGIFDDHDDMFVPAPDMTHTTEELMFPRVDELGGGPDRSMPEVGFGVHGIVDEDDVDPKSLIILPGDEE